MNPKYQLVKFPHEVLFRKSSKVELFNDELGEVLEYMHNIMNEHRGIGISAVQIGLPIQVLLILNRANMEVTEVINPEIVSTSGNQFFSEGCLSAPGLFVQTQRPLQVEFKYQTRIGEYKEGIVEGTEAVCLMHEMEHLEGKAFYDHKSVSRPQRRLVKKKLGL